MKINFYIFFFFLHWKTLRPKGSIFIFLVLLKLSKENEMSEVLGSFSADHAALYTAYRNIIPNELSFDFQKGGLSIYFLTYFYFYNYKLLVLFLLLYWDVVLFLDYLD